MITKRTPVLILLFCLFGLISAGFSLYEHTMLHAGLSGGPSFCNIGEQFNCDAINKSHYSTFLGVPLAQIAVTYYGIMALGAFISIFVGFGTAALGVCLVAGVFSVLLSLYLFFISKFVIGYFCLFCFGMYVANIGIFVTSYNAAKGQIGRVVHQGIFAPGEFLLNLLTGPKRMVGWTFLVLSGVFLYGTHLAPIYLVQTNNAEAQNQNKIAYNVWKKEPVAPLTIKTGGPLDGDYRKGSVGSPIEIVEYSDFECPACRLFYPRLETLLKKYEGKVTFIAKNFPLDQSCNKILPRPMHQHSCRMASFVRCAGEQGKFWEAYDEAFSNPNTLPESHDVPSDPIAVLQGWAQKSALDLEALNGCLNSERQLKKIREEVDEGIALHVESTPSVFVNGRLTHPNQVEGVIEALLASYSSTAN